MRVVSRKKRRSPANFGPQCSENGIYNAINDMCMSVVARHDFLINLV